MSSRNNPYNFGKPVKDPKLFAGRRKELEEIDYYLDLSKSARSTYYNLSLIGQRASGKTSLLNKIAHMAEQKGFLPVQISLNNESSTNEVMLFKEIFDAIMTLGVQKGMYDGLKGKAYRVFRKAVDMLEIDAELQLLFLTAYIGAKKQNNNTISQHVLQHDLKKFYEEAKNVCIYSIILLFDECDLLASNQTLLQKLRNVFSDTDGYMLVFSGTEKMFPAMNETFSPLPRLFKKIDVENFKDIKDTEECLLKPLDEEEKKLFDVGSIAEIHQFTNGSPYEINLVAHYMYRRWKEGKNSRISLSPEVLDDILNEIERLRKDGHYEIANKIKLYWKDQLEILAASLEFPNVSKEYLSEYMLLDEIDTLQLKDVYLKKSIIKDYISQLIKDQILEEKNDKILFKGNQFDILYLKYLCVTKDVRNVNEFFVGFHNDPILNLHHKFGIILLKDFQEYFIYTGFDKKERKEDKLVQKFTIGTKATLPPGENMITLYSNEIRNEFYQGAPNSIRFRVNLEWMKNGFVTQIKFKNEQDKERFQIRLDSLKHKLNLLGYEFILKDEMAWNVEGTEFSKQNKILEALQCFDKAIEINPSFEIPWGNKAGIFLNLKRFDEALQSADKALELSKSWLDMLKLKGMILLNLGRNEEAIESLEKATKIDPEDWSSWDNKGRAFLNLKKFQNAIDSLDKAINLKPDDYDALFFKGICLFQIKQYAEALENIESVLKQRPDHDDALLYKALVLHNLGRNTDALSIIDMIEQKFSNKIEVMEIKSLILDGLGRIDEAIDYCNKIVEQEPNAATSIYNRACFKVKTGDVTGGLEDLKKAILIEKEHFVPLAKQEKDFDGIKNNEEFKAIMAD